MGSGAGVALELAYGIVSGQRRAVLYQHRSDPGPWSRPSSDGQGLAEVTPLDGTSHGAPEIQTMGP